MLEALLLGLYILFIAPTLYSMGIVNPLVYFLILLVIIAPGLYAMIKGAPFIPTIRKKTDQMLALAEIKPDSVVYDLGSGDGRFVFGAAKLGAKKAIGYELSLPIYLYSKISSFFIKNSKIELKNFWNHPEKLKNADIIFCFLMIKSMANFETKIWPHLKPGTKVISNTFKMPNITPIYDKEGIRIYQK